VANNLVATDRLLDIGDFRLQPTIDIVIKVQDETGTPLPKASIVVIGFGARFNDPDPKGAVSFMGSHQSELPVPLDEGGLGSISLLGILSRYVIRAHASDHVDRQDAYDSSALLTSSPFTILLHSNPAYLVVDFVPAVPLNSLLSATVNLSPLSVSDVPRGSPRSRDLTILDPQKAFLGGVEPGRYRASFACDDLAPVTRDLDLRPGVNRCMIPIDSGFRVEGTVRHQDGSVCMLGAIHINSRLLDALPRTRYFRNGSFEVAGLPQVGWIIWGQCAEGTRTEMSLPVALTGESNLELRLVAGMREWPAGTIQFK
jgi:hypothetical protein